MDEAFARAWASWRTVSRHPAPAAWVVRTALNASISRWRRRRREVPVPDLALVADRPAVSGGASVRLIPGLWRRCCGCPPAAAGGSAAAVPGSGYRRHRAGSRHRARHGPGSPGPRDGRASRRPYPYPAGEPVMNDNELVTALRGATWQSPDGHAGGRDHQAGPRGARPARIPAVAGALGAAAAAAVAVSVALPASHPASEPGAQLAAWTVYQAGQRQYSGHHPGAARPGRTPAHAPRRWRPGQRHLHERGTEPGVPGLPRWR